MSLKQMPTKISGLWTAQVKFTEKKTTTWWEAAGSSANESCICTSRQAFNWAFHIIIICMQLIEIVTRISSQRKETGPPLVRLPDEHGTDNGMSDGRRTDAVNYHMHIWPFRRSANVIILSWLIDYHQSCLQLTKYINKTVNTVRELTSWREHTSFVKPMVVF